MEKRKSKFLSVFLSVIMAFSVVGVFPTDAQAAYTTKVSSFTYNGYTIPAYDGDPYEVVNKNDPNFKAAEKTKKAFENYSALDKHGRVGVAYANICQDIMPTEDRGAIGSIKPSGWVQNKYSFVDGKYLYNRCHLIGWQLAGENANEKNLMTGTRSFNVDGMLPWEDKVDDYVEETDNHVLYRVTPVFKGTNKLATGVLIEAESVEDNGKGIEFCVFVYNVEKGVTIDYATGNNAKATSTVKNIKNTNITLSCKNYVYNGKAKYPTVKVTHNGVTLKKGTHYTLKYSNNKNVGTGLVKITGKGKYSGSTTRSFSIKVKKPTISSVSKGKTYIKLSWNKPYGATGYQVAYKKASASDYKKIGTKNRSLKISGLSKGTNYHVKVRAYKVKNGTKYYGNWSTVKKVKTNGSSGTTVVTSYVYVTETGSKYHSAGCSYLSDSCYKITLFDAKAQGYEPCSRCH